MRQHWHCGWVALDTIPRRTTISCMSISAACAAGRDKKGEPQRTQRDTKNTKLRELLGSSCEVAVLILAESRRTQSGKESWRAKRAYFFFVSFVSLCVLCGSSSSCTR